jgi:hypothetical protein
MHIIKSAVKQVVGLLGRLVQGFLAQRLSSSAPSNLFYNKEGVMNVNGTHLSAVLEYVESPLQQMKRAGLGLLSMGLGRYVFSCV